MILTITDADLIAATVKDSVSARIIRGAAYFLLNTIGDIPDEDTVVPVGTSSIPIAAAGAIAAAAPAATGAAGAAPTRASNVSYLPPPPPPVSDVPLPSPPPIPVSGETDDENDETGEPDTGKAPPHPSTGIVPPAPVATAAPPVTSNAGSAADAVGVVSAEADSAGMPYDDRIHQKAKGKKKDGTWKLIKGVDTAIVQAVTAEIAARRAASPAPTAGSLPVAGNSASNGTPAVPPAGSNTVPVPPVPNDAAANGMSAQNNAGGVVPVPPAPAVGGVGASDASPYRKLIDKITDLTKSQKITPAKVMEICQSHGAPSLMALNGMQHLVPEVDKDIDAAALGLL